jgi:hypothetical protein
VKAGFPEEMAGIHPQRKRVIQALKQELKTRNKLITIGKQARGNKNHNGISETEAKKSIHHCLFECNLAYCAGNI